jgi:alpha-beta hydrolase superfamily lysophospholipase
MDVRAAETIQEEGTFTSPAAPGVTYHRITVRPAVAPVLARLAFVHGYGDHAGRYVEPMTWLASRGVACYGVDLRGHGRSSGRRAYVRRWDEFLDDVDAFLAELDRRDERDRSPLFVLGHSHGGLVAAVAGLRGRLTSHNVAGVILSAPYLVNAFRVPVHKSILARVANVCWPCLRIRSGIRPELTSSDPAMIEESQNDPLLLRCATPRWYLGHRRAQKEALGHADRFTLPLLVLQGDADTIADPRGASAFHDQAGSRDKTLITYPGFRHEPLRETGREQVYRDVLAWVARRAGALAGA